VGLPVFGGANLSGLGAAYRLSVSLIGGDDRGEGGVTSRRAPGLGPQEAGTVTYFSVMTYVK